MMPRALTIAGSDSGGGAGIQADLKTFTALGVYGMSAITAITAQNTLGVRRWEPVAPDLVAAQIDAVSEDIGADAAKTGMLGNAAIVETVASAIRRNRLDRLVIDPVLIASDGGPLLSPDARSVLRTQLLPLALILTPNLPEVELLLDLPPETLATEAARRDAARRLSALGPRWVVIKGGHLPGATALDLAFDGRDFIELGRPRIATRHTHGTGCTFSAAIAAHLARGVDVPTALAKAKEFVHWAISHALPLGHGHGPTNHFYHDQVGHAGKAHQR